MNLHSAIASELGFLRQQAESRMESRCAIRRRPLNADLPQDEGTGRETPAWDEVHTDEPLRYVAASTRRVDIDGMSYQEATGRADFRHDLLDLAEGDLIEITAGEWIGTVLRVVDAPKGDQRTARRVPVAETRKPTEWEGR